MKLIVGLGNPGKEYQKTRHNIGFMVLDALHDTLQEHGIKNWELSKKFNAEISGCHIHGEQIILAKPMTFMNDSGMAVQMIAHFYKLTRRDILVVHDDKDLPLGMVKFQENRGDAGHNGVKSIIEHLGTQNFTRIRVGVAPADPAKVKDTGNFVLGKFTAAERKILNKVIENIIKEIEHLI